MRAYQLFDLTPVARGVSYVASLMLAGPQILMSIPDYFDAGGPLVHLEPCR